MSETSGRFQGRSIYLKINELGSRSFGGGVVFGPTGSSAREARSIGAAPRQESFKRPRESCLPAGCLLAW